MAFGVNKQTEQSNLSLPGYRADQRRQLLQLRPHPDPSRLEDDQVARLLRGSGGAVVDTLPSLSLG